MFLLFGIIRIAVGPSALLMIPMLVIAVSTFRALLMTNVYISCSINNKPPVAVTVMSFYSKSS